MRSPRTWYLAFTRIFKEQEHDLVSRQRKNCFWSGKPCSPRISQGQKIFLHFLKLEVGEREPLCIFPKRGTWEGNGNPTRRKQPLDAEGELWGGVAAGGWPIKRAAVTQVPLRSPQDNTLASNIC